MAAAANHRWAYRVLAEAGAAAVGPDGEGGGAVVEAPDSDAAAAPAAAPMTAAAVTHEAAAAMIDAEVRRMLHDGGGDAELGNGTASRRLVAELGGREALSREAAAHMWTAGVVPLSGASLPPGAQEPNPRRLEALHLLYAAYAHLLLATDAIPAVHGEELFWRLCHWGLRQPDPHRPARKIAVALLRHGIACQAAAYISSAAGGAAAAAAATAAAAAFSRNWEVLFTVCDALEDFPMHMLWPVWRRLESLLPAEPATALYDDYRVGDAPAAGGARDAPATLSAAVPTPTVSPTAFLLAPAVVPTPVPGAARGDVPATWVAAVIERGITHEHAVVRRALFHGLLLADIAYDLDLGAGHNIGADGEPARPSRCTGVMAALAAGSSPAADAEVPTLARLPLGYTYSLTGLLGKCVDSQLFRGADDQLGRALQRFLTLHLTYLWRVAPTAAAAAVTALLHSLSALAPCRAAPRRILTALAAVRAAVPPPAGAVLRAPDLVAAREGAIALTLYNTRSYAWERQRELLGVVAGWSDVHTLNDLAAAALLLASVPAAMTAPGAPASAGVDVSTWLATAAARVWPGGNDAAAAGMAALVGQYVHGYDGAAAATDAAAITAVPWTAVSLARFLVAYPWRHTDAASAVLRPLSDALAAAELHPPPRAVLLAAALLVAACPRSRAADAHLAPLTPDLDAIPRPPGVTSALAAEFTAALGGSRHATTPPAAPPDDVYAAWAGDDVEAAAGAAAAAAAEVAPHPTGGNTHLHAALAATLLRDVPAGRALARACDAGTASFWPRPAAHDGGAAHLDSATALTVVRSGVQVLFTTADAPAASLLAALTRSICHRALSALVGLPAALSSVVELGNALAALQQTALLLTRIPLTDGTDDDAALVAAALQAALRTRLRLAAADSEALPEGVSLADVRQALEAARWAAVVPLLAAVLAPRRDSSSSSSSAAPAAAPLMEEVAEAVLSGLTAGHEAYGALVLAAAGMLLRHTTCVSGDGGEGRLLAALRVAEPLLAPRNNRRSLYQLAAAVVQPAVFLLPHLHAPGAPLPAAVAWLVSLAADETRPPWATQVVAARLVVAWGTVLAAASAPGVPPATARAHTATLLTYVPTMAYLALHREFIPLNEDPALAATGARETAAAWHAAQAARGGTASSTWNDVAAAALLPPLDVPHPAASDAAASVAAARLRYRGAGAITRLQLLYFFEAVGAAAARQRGAGGGPEAPAVALHRALILRLTRLQSLPPLRVEPMPGSPLQLTKLRCWQALAVLLREWGRCDGGAAPGVVYAPAADVYVGVSAAASSELAPPLPTTPPTALASLLALPPDERRAICGAGTTIATYHAAVAAGLVVDPLVGERARRAAAGVGGGAAAGAALPPKKSKMPRGKAGSGGGGGGGGGASDKVPEVGSVESVIDVAAEMVGGEVAPGDAAALLCEAAAVPDDVVVAVVVGVVVRDVLSTMQLPSLKQYVEVGLQVLARRFPHALFATLLRPLLTEPNARGGCVLSAMAVAADMTRHLVRAIPRLAASPDAAASVPPLTDLLAEVFALVRPWTAASTGVLRCLAACVLRDAAPLLFPHLYDAVGRVVRPASCRDPHYDTAALLAMLQDSTELSTMVARQSALVDRTDPATTATLRGLLCEPVSDNGELMPAGVLEEAAALFGEATSLAHVADRHSWSTTDALEEAVVWGVRTGVLPARAIHDERLAYMPWLTGATSSDAAEPAATTDDEDGTLAFNFQRKVTSAVAVAAAAAATAAATPGSVLTLAAPPFVHDAALAGGGVHTRGVLTALLAREHAVLTATASNGRRCQPLLVVASLLDKAPNLGGLARTAEIFGAEALVVPDARIVSDPVFQDTAVTAAQWVAIHECPPASLHAYLRARRAQGYTLVGLEQAARSRPLGTVAFPAKVALVLGAELRGLPADVLAELDLVIEIPQLGVVRSLNVHVSAALTIWEYTRQRLAATTIDS